MYYLEDIKSFLESKLQNTTNSLLSGFRFSSDNVIIPKDITLYYWLGTIIQPKSLLEIGFHLGLRSGLFLKSCKSVSSFLAFQQKNDEFYSPRLGKSNIKDHYKSDFYVHIGNVQEIQGKEYDLVLINENLNYDKARLYLECAWEKLISKGFIIMDYFNEKAFYEFCLVKNRKPVIIKTIYGIIQK